MKKVYTPEEIANGLNVSKKAIYKWLTDGSLKGFRVGHLWRIRREDIEEFIGIPIPWEEEGEGD